MAKTTNVAPTGFWLLAVMILAARRDVDAPPKPRSACQPK